MQEPNLKYKKLTSRKKSAWGEEEILLPWPAQLQTLHTQTAPERAEWWGLSFSDDTRCFSVQRNLLVCLFGFCLASYKVLGFRLVTDLLTQPARVKIVGGKTGLVSDYMDWILFFALTTTNRLTLAFVITHLMQSVCLINLRSCRSPTGICHIRAW